MADQTTDPAPSQDDTGTKQPTDPTGVNDSDQDTANAPSGTDPVEEQGPANEPEGADSEDSSEPEAVTKVETNVSVEK